MSLMAMLVDYVTEIEEKLPMFIQKRLYQPRLVEKPNTPIPRKVKIFKRLLWEITGDPSCESQQAVQEVLKNRFQKAKFEDSQKISRIEARLNEQQRAIKQLKKLAQSQTKLLQDLTASLGLGTGNEQNATIIDGLSTEYGFRSRHTWLH
ncbi:Hypothetical predicted protein [Paramuricea clavata]|nr:Hypothetical predicted protein [Paramuricea clavata]